MPLQSFLLVFASWVKRRQLEIAEPLQEENLIGTPRSIGDGLEAGEVAASSMAGIRDVASPRHG